jgi:hypothetical protein
MYQGSPEIFVNEKSKAGAEGKERIRVWPNLVIREAIAALAAIILLLFFSVLFNAPLEGIADPSFSMNPSKAPWYFLGLQELLVYFTPWIAGVVIPIIVIVGLMAIPYIDVGRKNKKGGPVFIYEKQISRLFSAGLLLWVILTIIGLYFRGPNWAWQWPNGNPIESGENNITLNWLLPVVIFLYLAALLTRRLGHRLDHSGKQGIIRQLFSHFLTILGLIMVVKVAVYNILDFVLK